MIKDIKLLLITFGFSALLIAGFLLLQGKLGSSGETSINVPIEGVEASPETYDLGDVLIKGGKVYKTYELRNVSGNTLKLKKIATSCMCTKTKIKIGDKETRFFGMEGHTDRNPAVNLEFPKDATAVVTVEFDPAAHGPQGVGSFERIVYLTFSDPAGVKELKFFGTVVN